MDVIMQRSRREDERRQGHGHGHARGVPSVAGVPAATGVARASGRRTATGGNALIATMLMAAGVCLATDYVWTGNGNDDYYHTAANWSPNTGWPNCCDDAAVVTDVDSGSGWTYVWLSASGLTGAAVEQVTVKEEENGGHDGQTVDFHHESGSDPVLRCEVYVVDAVEASYPVTAQVSGAAMVRTVPTCICSTGG